MQAAVETLSDLGLQIKISVPANKLESAYNKRINEVAKTAKVDGFRPGKVPVAYVVKMYGPGIQTEVVDDLVRNSFNEVCVEKKIAVAGIDKVDVSQQELGKDLEFSINVETFPEIVFSDEDFTKMKVEKLSATVSDKDVDSSIEKLQKAHAQWNTAGGNSKAKMGDKVVLDFTAVQDGKDLEAGSAKDFELELGSKYLIPGFEEGVVSHKANDVFDLDLTFPEDYHAAEQAGKDVKFTVTLKEIKRSKLPELDQEFCAKFGIVPEAKEVDGSAEDKAEEKTTEVDVDVAELVTQLKAKIKESLEAEIKNQTETKFKNGIFDTLRDNKKLSVPKTAVETEITEIVNQQLDKYREQVGDKNAKLDLDRGMFREQALKNVHLRLLVRAFIEQYDVKTDREQVRAKLKEVMGGHDISDDLLNWYYSEPSRLQQIEALALEEMVTTMIQEKITVTEKEVSFEDLMEK